MKKWFGLDGVVDYSKGWLRVGRYWLGVWRGRPRLVPVIAGGTAANTTQEDFWFRNDNGSLTTATYIGSQNSNYAPTISANHKFRIRIIAQENNGKNDPWAFQLGAKKNGVGSYTLITTGRTDGIRYADDGNGIADGTAIATADFDLTYTGTPTDGEYDDAQTSAGTSTISVNGTYTELEFCVEGVVADLTNGDYFEFNLLDTSGGALDGYNTTPRVTFTVQTVHTATATLAGSGTLTATGSVTHAATATLGGAGTLTAVGNVNPTTWQYVQSNVQPATSDTITLDGVTAGNLIILVAKWATTTNPITGVSDGTDNLTGLTQQDVNGGMSAQIWYLLSSTAGNKTYTVSYDAAATTKRMIVAEFSYQNTASMDGENTNSGNSAATSVTLTPTTGGNNIVFASSTPWSALTPSNQDIDGEGYDTPLIEVNTTMKGWFLYTTQTGAMSISNDWSSADYWVIESVTFLDASATVTGTATLAGQGTLTAAPSVTRAATAQLDGAGALTAIPAITRAVTATLAGSGTLTAVATVGVVYPWCDGFESGGTSAWTGTSGTVTINGTAAIDGSFGMELDTTNVEYVYKQWSNSTQNIYRVEFKINTNNLTASGADQARICLLYDGAQLASGVTLIWGSGAFNINPFIRDDLAAINNSANNPITSGVDVLVEVEYVFQDTTGYARCWLDGVLVNGLANIDCGTRIPDEVRFGQGAVASAFDSGTYHLDTFCLYDTLRPVQGTATLSGAGTLVASPSVTRSVTATLQGTGTLQAIPAVTRAATATLAGQGTLTAVGAITGAINSGAILNGVGGLVAVGVVVRVGVATLPGTGTLVAVGTVQLAAITGAAVLAGQGNLTAVPAITRAVVAVLDGSGALVAAGTVVRTHTAAALLAGTGTLTATASLLGTVTAAALLAGAGTMQAIPAVTRTVTALLAGQGTLTASAQNYKNAVATLDGQGGVTAQAAVLHAALAVLAGAGTLTARGSYHFDTFYFDPDKNVFVQFRDKRSYAGFRDKRTYADFRDKRKEVK